MGGCLERNWWRHQIEGSPWLTEGDNGTAGVTLCALVMASHHSPPPLPSALLYYANRFNSEPPLHPLARLAGRVQQWKFIIKFGTLNFCVSLRRGDGGGDGG